jgi:hypothetical protein
MIRYISCLCCPQYCKNKDKNKIIKILKDLKKDGIEEVVFACDTLNGFAQEAERIAGIKVKELKK